MPRYTVLVTRDATESARVTIYAPDPLEAERRAVLFAAENPHVEWAPDDGNFHKPYICDPGNCAELVPDNASDNRTHPPGRALDALEGAAALPTITIGGLYVFAYPHAFTTLPEYTAHKGSVVTVLRECIEGEEYDNPGIVNEGEPSDLMFEVQAEDGWKGFAWQSELEPVTAPTPTPTPTPEG